MGVDALLNSLRKSHVNRMSGELNSGCSAMADLHSGTSSSSPHGPVTVCRRAQVHVPYLSNTAVGHYKGFGLFFFFF